MHDITVGRGHVDGANDLVLRGHVGVEVVCGLATRLVSCA